MAEQAAVFFKTFLINLDRATERLSMMTGRLAAMSLQFERVPATDGAQLAFPRRDFDERAYRRQHGRRCNEAEVGCYLSHVECARRLLQGADEFALILEDDVEFSPDFLTTLEAALAQSDSWDLLRLSSVNNGRLYSYASLVGERHLAVALTREKGSGAYVINRAAARWILESLTPMALPYDIAFDNEFRAGLKASFVSPAPVNQCIGMPSQIQPRSRRQFHLSRWRYVTVLPFRAGVEIERFTVRGWRLFKHRVMAAWGGRRTEMAARIVLNNMVASGSTLDRATTIN